MKSTKAIRELIEASIDDERMMEHESRSVGGHRGAVLERLAAERGASVEKLRELGSRRGDIGSHHRSWTELGRELGRSFRVFLAGEPCNSDSVAACRRACIRTKARFDEALELAWPEAIRSILVEQRAQLDGAREALLAIQY
jgi:hypothetical protein